MPDGIPCPNPTCVHNFPASAVKGSAVLTCPRCGTVFKFRQPAAPPPAPAAPPLAKPVAKQPPARGAPPPLPPPLAAPVALATPVAPAVGRAERVPDPALNLESSPEMVLSPSRRRKPRRGKGGWIRLAIAFVLVVGVCSAVAYGIYWGVKNAPVAEIDDSPAARKSLGNFSFDPQRGWKQDSDVQLSMRVRPAFTRKKPRSHFGLAYRDYKTRTPSDAELLSEALKKLRAHFVKVDYEDPLSAKDKGRTGTLGGEPAIVFPFVGTDKNEVVMKGEASMLARQGYAYWVFAWGPDDDNAEQLPTGWEAMREGFKLYNERAGWSPRPREATRFASGGVRLDYFQDLWKPETAADYDDKCILALKGFEPVEDEETGKKRTVVHAGKHAIILVLVLPRKAEDKDAKAAYKTAEAYVLKKEAETYANVKFEPSNDKPAIEPDVGAIRGQLSHLRVVRDPETERYGVLAVAGLSADKILAVYAVAETPYEPHAFWKHEFKAVIATVQRSKE